MKLRISYPGQAVQVVDATPNQIEHFKTKGWTLPFIEVMCMCADRPLSDCPGEWEPGCDLGNNPKFMRVGRERWPRES